VVFNSSSPSSSSITPNPHHDLPLSITVDDIAIRSVPYPELVKAHTITLPIVLSEQEHPKIYPSNKRSWTEDQRVTVSNIIAKPSNKAKTLKDVDRLVSESDVLVFND
jgi:hypothetical protein